MAIPHRFTGVGPQPADPTVKLPLGGNLRDRKRMEKRDKSKRCIRSGRHWLVFVELERFRISLISFDLFVEYASST